MTRFADHSQADQTRLIAAADWHERLRVDPSLEFSSEFISWSEEDRNLEALRAIQLGLTGISAFGAEPEIVDMRRDALSRLRRQPAYSRYITPMRAIAAACVITLLAGGALLLAGQDQSVLVTGIGERRVVPLPDGSRISLDSDTSIRVRYSNAVRAIELERGRARFDVAHDTARPFAVSAGDEVVVAVGTSFNVERLNRKVLVTLIQGKVIIKPAVDAVPVSAVPMPQPVPLSEGQELIALKDTVPQIRPVNLESAMAWEAGQLIFRDEPLAEAVPRINRYANHPIKVDASVAAIRISGVFNAGDVDAFVSAVTGYFPVRAAHDLNGDLRLLAAR